MSCDLLLWIIITVICGSGQLPIEWDNMGILRGDALLLWNIMMKLLCSVIDDYGSLRILYDYELLWAIVMIIMGLYWTFVKHFDEKMLVMNTCHINKILWLRGERHKGWIHLYPDDLDILEKKKELQMFQWYVKRIGKGWTWGHGEILWVALDFFVAAATGAGCLEREH